MVPREEGLGIEGVDLAWATVEEHKDDSLGFGREHWRARRERISRVRLALVGHCLFGKQTQKRDIAKAKGAGFQQFTARKVVLIPHI